jgi:hypothetical protein
MRLAYRAIKAEASLVYKPVKTTQHNVLLSTTSNIWLQGFIIHSAGGSVSAD